MKKTKNNRAARIALKSSSAGHLSPPNANPSRRAKTATLNIVLILTGKRAEIRLITTYHEATMKTLSAQRE